MFTNRTCAQNKHFDKFKTFKKQPNMMTINNNDDDEPKYNRNRKEKRRGKTMEIL